jgi:NADPH:quinone reductase-like Zn-dependent oxidoreductase
MHAIVVTQPGDPDVLSWREVPDPVAGLGEVVVDLVILDLVLPVR